jgi:class 3 adenylate cyclase
VSTDDMPPEGKSLPSSSAEPRGTAEGKKAQGSTTPPSHPRSRSRKVAARPKRSRDLAKQLEGLSRMPNLAKQLEGLSRVPDLAKQLEGIQLAGLSRVPDLAKQLEGIQLAGLSYVPDSSLIFATRPPVLPTTPRAIEPAGKERPQEEAEARRAASQAIPPLSLLETHAPPNWQESYPAKRLAWAISKARPIDVVAIATDIRSSTLLMKEAKNPLLFAGLLTSFADRAQSIVWEEGGWFDKFTGDGILAYWLYPTPAKYERALKGAVQAIRRLFDDFYERLADQLMANSKFFPGAELSAGLDAGRAVLVSMAGSLTIVGDPVVGAARMVEGAREKETLIQGHVGQYILDAQLRGRFPDLELRREKVKTKEYEAQVVFGLAVG